VDEISKTFSHVVKQRCNTPHKLAKMMKAVVAVALALVTPVSARWTGNVLIYNLLANRTIEWMGANATGKNGEELFSIS